MICTTWELRTRRYMVLLPHFMHDCLDHTGTGGTLGLDLVLENIFIRSDIFMVKDIWTPRKFVSNAWYWWASGNFDFINYATRSDYEIQNQSSRHMTWTITGVSLLFCFLDNCSCMYLQYSAKYRFTCFLGTIRPLKREEPFYNLEHLVMMLKRAKNKQPPNNGTIVYTWATPLW